MEFAQIYGLCSLPSPQKISQLKKKQKKTVSLSLIRGLFIFLFIPVPKRIHGKNGSVYASRHFQLLITKWKSGKPTLSQLIHWSPGVLIPCKVSFFKSWLFIVIICTISISNWGENQVPLLITDLNLDDLRNTMIGQELYKRATCFHP